MKLKARSRLATTRIDQPDFTPNLIGITSHRRLGLTQPHLSFQTPPQWWTQRQPKIFSLIIALVIYSYLGYLLTHVFPSQVRDWLIPGSFLPILGLAALAHLYFWSFVTLSPRTALFISLLLSWWLWLQLHHFELSWEVVGTSLAVFIGLELSFHLVKKFNRQKYKFQTPAR